MAKRLFIGRLPTDVTESDLAELFAQAGEVVSVSIKFDHATGNSRGFGFVQMRDNHSAQVAIETLNGALMKGRNIRVVEAEKRGSPKKRPTASSDPITEYDPTPPPASPASKPLKRRPWLVPTLLILGAGALTLWLGLDPALDPHTVLIAPFNSFEEATNDPNKPQVDYVGHALAEALAVNLAYVPKLRTLPVPAPGEHTNADELAASARKQGAGIVLTGSVRRNGDQLETTITGIDTRQNKVLWGVHDKGRSTEIEPLAASLTRTIVNKMGLKLPMFYRYVTNLRGGPRMSEDPLTEKVNNSLRVADYAAALGPTSSLIRKYPTDYAAWVLRAHTLALRWASKASVKNLHQLEVALTRLDAVDPNNPYSSVYRAFVLTRTGRQLEAIPALTKLMNRVDISPAGRAWVLRYRSYAKQLAHMDGHMADLKESQRLDPTNPWTLGFLSNAYAADGDLQKALRFATLALSMQPGFWRNHESIGYVFDSLGRHADATAAYAKACELGKSQDPCSIYSVSAFKAGNTKAAAAAARKAERMVPSVYGNYNLACYAALVGKTDKALKLLQRSVRMGLADTSIHQDEDLKSIRNTEEYKALVAEVDQRLKEQSLEE